MTIVSGHRRTILFLLVGAVLFICLLGTKLVHADGLDSNSSGSTSGNNTGLNGSGSVDAISGSGSSSPPPTVTPDTPDFDPTKE